MRVTSPIRAAECEPAYRHRPALTWPDHCHRCATAMVFEFDSGPLHRRCPRCQATAHIHAGRMVLSPIAR